MADLSPPDPQDRVASGDGDSPKKPWWKRWWGITLLVVGALIVLGGIFGESPDSDPVATDTTSPTTADSPATSPPSPTPSPTPTPTPTPTPAFNEPINLSGSGDDIVDLQIPGNAPAVLEISHQGSRNFIVEAFDSTGTSLDVLVNEIGNYSGIVPVGLFVGENVADLEITASGPWSVEARPLSMARQMGQNGRIQGSGDDVFTVPEGLGDRAEISHNGSSGRVPR